MKAILSPLVSLARSITGTTVIDCTLVFMQKRILDDMDRKLDMYDEYIKDTLSMKYIDTEN